MVRYWKPEPGGTADFLCGRFEAGPSTAHVHDEWQFAVADESATLLVGAYRRHTVLPGQVAVVRPYEVHGEAGGRTWRVLYVADALMRRLAGETTPACPPTLLLAHPGAAAELRGLLRDSEDGAIEAARFAALAEQWLRRFASQPAGAVPVTPRQPRSTVERVRAYLRERPTEAVSLADLAPVAGVAPSHLVRSFSRQVGLPPKSYHLHARLALARRLLAEGRTATWVAYECGFADQSHLSRRFKQCYRLTPGAFQAQCARHPTSEPGSSAA
jgi:AraC-like DNA-binding protein